MIANFTKVQEYCATYQYWQGERKTDSPRTHAVLPIDSTQEKCVEKRITKAGVSNSSCNNWVVWGLLACQAFKPVA
jgi:hypothetical protein